MWGYFVGSRGNGDGCAMISFVCFIFIEANLRERKFFLLHRDLQVLFEITYAHMHMEGAMRERDERCDRAMCCI